MDGYGMRLRGGIGRRPRWQNKTRKEENQVVAERGGQWPSRPWKGQKRLSALL